MDLRVKWNKGVSFIASSKAGHEIVMDGPANLGGENKGMRPMEVLLSGVGGCTSFDVVTILKKSRQEVSDCEALISAERAEIVPKVFTKIHIHFKVYGKNLNPKTVERAIELSATKYCSASIMLGQSVKITHDFELLETGN